MAEQKIQRRFNKANPVPYSGRKRRKKNALRVKEIPDGFGNGMMIRYSQQDEVDHVDS